MSFDFASASELQKRNLHRIVHNCNSNPSSDEVIVSDFLDSRETIWFILTLDGLRDGCDIGSVSFDERDTGISLSDESVEFLDSLPLEYSYYCEELQRDDGVELFPTLIMRGDDQYERVFSGSSKVTDVGLSDREQGELYGYPEWAIDAFVGGETMRRSDVVEDEVVSSFSVDELKYLYLVPFSPPLDSELLEESIEWGKRFAERSVELAEEFSYLRGLQYRVEIALSSEKEQLEYLKEIDQCGWEKP